MIMRKRRREREECCWLYVIPSLSLLILGGELSTPSSSLSSSSSSVSGIGCISNHQFHKVHSNDEVKLKRCFLAVGRRYSRCEHSRVGILFTSATYLSTSQNCRKTATIIAGVHASFFPHWKLPTCEGGRNKGLSIYHRPATIDLKFLLTSIYTINRCRRSEERCSCFMPIGILVLI